jgi:hypothetical protein
MAAAALVLGILSSVFSIGKNAYELKLDVQGQHGGVMAASVQRPMIDMTPLETNLSLGGK